MRLHIVEGQLSTQPHRVCLFEDDRAKIVRIVNAHEDGDLIEIGTRTEESDQLRGDLADARDDLDEKADDLRQAERRNSELQHELDEAEDKISELQEELDALRRTSSAAE